MSDRTRKITEAMRRICARARWAEGGRHAAETRRELEAVAADAYLAGYATACGDLGADTREPPLHVSAPASPAP
jgi:hypothetical protein